MTSHDPQRDLPSDVPAEYADTYRRAYEEALREHVAEPVPARHEESRRPLWPLVLLALAVAALLVGGAYGLGRVISGSPTPGDSSSAQTRPATAPTTPTASATSPAAQVSPRPSGTPSPTPSATPAGPYRGKVAAVRPTGASAGCTATPGVDSSGARVTYGAANLIDGNTTTAWRCDGRGIGTTISIALPPGTRVAELGLIPGYAKTDPASGEDRYAENNRITGVRWTFSDGTSLTQKFDGTARDRSLRTMRVPLTVTDSLTLSILSTVKGERNTTMISELRVASGR